MEILADFPVYERPQCPPDLQWDKERINNQLIFLYYQAVQLYFNSSNVPHIEESSSDAGYWHSVKHVLKDITNAVAVESGVIHPLLGYGGTLDLIAEYKGKLSVIDWKTSAKHKTKLKDCFAYPQQIVAYAGAVNYDDNYPFQV